MTKSDGCDELFGEAVVNASQNSFTDAGWGAELRLAENERWAGRFRGRDLMLYDDRELRVYLLENFDGTPLFIRGRTKLDRQFDQAKSNTGDTVAIVRLDDVPLDGGKKMHDYGVAVERADGPSPAKPAPSDGIPF